MTQLPSHTHPSASASSRCVAGVHDHPSAGGAGASVAVVILQDGDVVASRLFDSRDASGIAAEFARRGVGRVVRIAPPHRTVVRVAPAPDDTSDGERLSAALGLLAEAELPSTTPAHRRCGGILTLPNPDGRSMSRGVLLSAWLDDADPPAAIAPLTSESWTSLPAALAMLAGAAAASWSVWSDRSTQTVSAVAASPQSGTIVARVLRGSGERDSSRGWPRQVREAVEETLVAAGIEGDELPLDAVSDAGHDLFLPDHASAANIAGQKRDSDWLSSFGPAFGAALLASASDPSVRSMASMLARPIVRRRPLPERAVAWFAPPQRAAIALAACVGTLLFAPLAFSAARSAVLLSRAESESALSARLDEAERRAAFSQLLRQKRWPMSKLLADAARAAPVGLTLDSFEIAQGEGMTLRGVAESAELITEFRARLADTMVFTQVVTPTIGAEGGRVAFQLQAKVGNPLFTPKADDFVKEPLAVRLYGPGATPSSGRAEPASGSASDRSGAAGSSSRSADSRAPASRPDRTRTATRAAPDAPAPLTDEQIAAMDRETAMKEWTSRNLASKRVEDPETRRRLAEEAEKCRARFVSLNTGGAG